MTDSPKTSRPSHIDQPVRSSDLVDDLHAMMDALIQRCGESKRLGIEPDPSELLTLYELAIRLDLLIESYESV